MVRKFLVKTFGCQMNEHDSERISGLLMAEGMVPTEDVESADVVVLNTCCIRENADNRLYGNLGHLRTLKQRKPWLQIAVAGCLAQKDKELIREKADHVDVVFGTFNVHRAPELLRLAQSEGPQVEVWDGPGTDSDDPYGFEIRPARESGHQAWVTIQVGCNNSCSFCIVPSVRGPEASKPFQRVVDEVSELARQGVIEVTLLGQNVNSYGRDITLSLRTANPDSFDVALAGERWARDPARRPRPLFADLLRAVGSVEGIRRVRFTSPHPKDLLHETIEAMAETPAVCEQLHLPLQSGSDRVLAEMRRGYTASRYLERLAEARRRISDLAVTTDIIVGFPGESDADFEETLEVVAEAEFDSAYTFEFSPRPNTRAAEMHDRFVDPAKVSERFLRLKQVVDRSALIKHRARIGRLEEVLVEGRSRRDGSLVGRTRQGKLVHLRDAELPAGSLANVLVTDAGAHHLVGEIVEEIERPRRARLGVVAG